MTRLPRSSQRRVLTFPAARHRAAATAAAPDTAERRRRHGGGHRAPTSSAASPDGTASTADAVESATGPRSLPTRAVQLVAGTVVMGLGISLLVYSRLGLAPMDVLHAGVARTFGWTFGGGIIAVQAVLLATYLPLRIVPGPGTVLGFLIPAVTADVLVAHLPQLDALPARLAMLTCGGILFCLGVAIYLVADLGRMPRDGIMLALAGGAPTSAAHARRIARARIGIDIALVCGGVLLLGPSAALRSGSLGVGTLLLAFGSGPLIAVLWRFLMRVPKSRRAAGIQTADRTAAGGGS